MTIKHLCGKVLDIFIYKKYFTLLSIAGWSSLVARRAHNPKVIGSNPFPATKNFKALGDFAGSLYYLFPTPCG